MRKNTFGLVVAIVLMHAATLPAQDRFAEIGTSVYQTREHLLVTPQPPVLEDIRLPMKHKASSAFKRVDPINTKKELYDELKVLRNYYTPFLKDLAPPTETKRSRVYLDSFDWRIETPEDRTNFQATLQGKGSWEVVNIPHYTPPLGRATSYYRKEVQLDNKMLSKGSLFVHFKGVDYIASVFVNGSLVGTHEGFFAPFEFNITDHVFEGNNVIVVKVDNDFTTSNNTDEFGNKVVGDKIFAATGPGYDDPKLGWHHGAAAMGIYQDCYLEARAPMHINDIFIRPILGDSIAEAWVEVNNFNEVPHDTKLSISVFGQNFEDTVIKDYEYIPTTVYIPGVGDLAKPQDWEKSRLKMGYGVNYLRIPLKMKNYRLWDGETPWLYQVQIKLFDQNEKHADTQVQQFGMRSFTMDTTSTPKGKMYLNGKMVRLRGANTMGHFQQCVMKKDWDQLIDDVLLAKLANMNFIRLTQRPVQPEIYEYFDKLGMMHQVDFPLFGSIRRNQFAEAVKQAEEMERLVRSHPSTIVATYINERFPNAEGKPQRSLNTAEEYYKLFKAMDQAILLSNPDRVIKAGDGDYDPPTPGLPDSHCYNTWYNGHGLGLGEMYKGQWQPIKPGWLYGCGEFGSEGLDPRNVMEKYYPKDWLPQDKEDDKTWNANRIAKAQTNRFHYMWYNTQHSLDDWIEASQDYQAWATQFVTETFRRDPRMVSFAIHLFIDAWPAGWMKTIMDVDRQPKKAYFTYRNALEPLMISLRSDRRHFFEGEETSFEAWICNDLNEAPEGYQLKYQIERKGKVILANQVDAHIPVNSSQFQGFLKFKTPRVSKRTAFTLRAALYDADGKSVYQNHFDFEVFPKVAPTNKTVFVLGDNNGNAARMIDQAGIQSVRSMGAADVIVADDFAKYKEKESEINGLVRQGKRLLFFELTEGSYDIAGTTLTVHKTRMGDYYFASPQTGHELTKKAGPFDFRFWYDEEKDVISPILFHNVKAPGWNFILSSGLTYWRSTDQDVVHAAWELKYGEGTIRFCQVQLLNKVKSNPTAKAFLNGLLQD